MPLDFNFYVLCMSVREKYCHLVSEAFHILNVCVCRVAEGRGSRCPLALQGIGAHSISSRTHVSCGEIKQSKINATKQ